MAKPIKLTEEWIKQMAEEFMAKLRGANLSDGKVTYTKSFQWKDDKVKINVLFEPAAYAKMLLLLHNFSSEVAWHGTVDRLADDCFVIKDILVYPQTVSGVTVNTDQERYQTWLMNLDDEAACALRMQAHSHVNMAVTPSSVDLENWQLILDQLKRDQFYIFMIYNKRLEHTVKVYDLKTNTLYEGDDISVGLLSDSGDLETFLKDAKDEVVTEYTVGRTGYTGQYSGGSYGGQYGGQYGGSYGGYDYGGTSKPKAGFKSASEEPAKKNEDAPAKNNITRYPGYFRARDDGGIDYDAMIYGARCGYDDD